MSLGIKHIAFVNFPTSDVPRTRAFYENVLGLKSTMALEFEAGKWWLEYDIGDTTLALSNAWVPPGKGGATVALEVIDLDAALAKLKSAGVAIAYGPHETPVCRIFGLADPDGNLLAIHQRKSS